MKRAGYTLIEVMTAVVVMTIGATGIVAMQGAAVRANQDASETSNAVNFASTWIERLKRDSRRWIQNGGADLTANSVWLSKATTSEGQWFVPETTPPEQPAADINGFDTSNEFVPIANNPDQFAHFCANVRLTVVQAYNPLTATFDRIADVNAIRTDVRVWWHRQSSEADRTKAKCRGTPLDPSYVDGPASYAYRKTYLSNVVTWKAPGWP
jgi:prepilin-type N-terminal cleavage/methylation domain-containing protein